jgi:sulfatase modifying factor 1
VGLVLTGFLTVKAFTGDTATAVATVTGGFVTGITVTSGGSGYRGEPAVTIVGGGGNGALAKAFLSGEKIGMIVVLSAGSGYTSSPRVVISDPSVFAVAPGLNIRMVPAITITGPQGDTNVIEWAMSPAGPWVKWTNVVSTTNGVTAVDLATGASERFYRVGARMGGGGNSGGPIGSEGFTVTGIGLADPSLKRLEMALIPAGFFQMGSPTNEVERVDDERQHTVTITRAFWIGKYEVTQGQWSSVMGNNPSYGIGSGLNAPVEQITWGDATNFCARLNLLEAGRIPFGYHYRLPTESEWEYAARAGTTTAVYCGDSLSSEQANFAGNYPYGGAVVGPRLGRTSIVGSYPPNPWGLFDMAGNVLEWCWDYLGEYPLGHSIDPKGPSSGSNHVYRGGGWLYRGHYCRSAFRGGISGSFRMNNIGFRVVLAPIL